MSDYEAQTLAGCVFLVLFSVIPPCFKWVRRKLVGRIRIDNEAALLDYIIRLANSVDGPPPWHPDFPLGGSVSRAELNPLARAMAAYMGMTNIEFRVNVSEIGEGVAGNVGLGGSWQRVVDIGISQTLLAHSDAVVKVLAHELSHKYLEIHGLILSDPMANELLTDLASIYLGFGAYVVSGSRLRELMQTSVIGYLTQTQCAWAYNIVRELRSDPFSWHDSSCPWIDFGDAQNYNNYESYKYLVVKFNKWVARLHESLELVELELCNLEKVCRYLPDLRSDMRREVEVLRKRSVFVKKRLGVIEGRFASARERVKPLVAYVSVRSDRYGTRQLNEESKKLVQEVQSLNILVSRLACASEVAAQWSGLSAIIIDCPDCGGHLRVPTGLRHIAVVCPRCRFAFDFSTLSPVVKSDQWLAFKAHLMRLRQKVDGYKTVLLIVAVLTCIFASGIYWQSDFHRERECWANILEGPENVESLRQYLKLWPAGKHIAEANDRISKIRAKERAVLELNSIEAVSRYLTRYPEEDAAVLRAEQYAAISNAPTFIAYRDFSWVLTGKENYYSDVTNTLMSLVRQGWDKARRVNTEAGYIAFIREFDEMPEYTEKARARIDEFYSDYDFVCQKDDIASFERYLRAHPYGRKADDVRKRLVLKKIEKVRRFDHAEIEPPQRVKELNAGLPFCWYSVTNQLPYKIEVLVGNKNYAKEIVLESMAGGYILMPTGTYERCVIVSSSAHPAYSKSEFYSGAYGEGFHVVTKLGRANGRNGDWADSTIRDADYSFGELGKQRREFEELRKRYGLPADFPPPEFPCQK